MSIAKMNKSIISLFLTGVLLIAAIVFLFFSKMAQGMNLWIDVVFFALLNVGLIVALVMGVKTKNKSIAIFSVLVNTVLFLIGSFIIFIYLFVIIVT